jgi:hypothetical protein
MAYLIYPHGYNLSTIHDGFTLYGMRAGIDQTNFPIEFHKRFHNT